LSGPWPRSSDRQACPFPGSLTRAAADLELATIHRPGRVDCTAAGAADFAAQSDAAGVAGVFSVAGPQKGTGPSPDDGQAQTSHLLRLVLGEANVADSGVGFLVGTTGAALLAVVNRPIPHVSPFLAPRLLRRLPHATRPAGSRATKANLPHNEVSAFVISAVETRTSLPSGVAGRFASVVPITSAAPGHFRL